jgi:hypothetical protein
MNTLRAVQRMKSYPFDILKCDYADDELGQYQHGHEQKEYFEEKLFLEDDPKEC